MAEPKSSAPATSSNKAVLIATEARLERAVLAPPNPERVWSPVLVPEIVAFAVTVRFPCSFTVLEALSKSKVRVLPAVNAVVEVAAKVTSKAAEVSLMARPVSPVMLPPAMVGAVARTALPVPVTAVIPVPFI